MPEIRIIEPVAEQAKKLRVAAYARVSSDSADQMNSFANQVGYYTDYIQSNNDWEFAGLYADEGVTGTMTDKRDDFQRLIRDCRAGKIDRVIVKSISRIARNTLDCIQTVRELRQFGVAVKFEKEGIDTANMGSEMLLSMLSSVAQEESISISKNLKWSFKKRIQSKDFITCSAPLGYFYKNKTLVPDSSEVPIVEYIYLSYLAGKSIMEIAAELTAMENKYTRTKSSRWSYSTICYILRNEKYAGDSLVQKTYTPDELPLRKRPNHGEVTQYYIYNSHTAIIPRAIFEAVQELLEKRRRLYAHDVAKKYPLSRIIKCGLCGSTFRHRISNTEHKWACQKHLKDKKDCAMRAITEQEIYTTFFTLFNKLLENRDSILGTLFEQLQELQTRTKYARPDFIALNQQVSDLVKQNHALTRLQAKGCIDSALFIERSNRNNSKIEELRAEMRKLETPDDTSDILDKTKLILDLMDGASPMLEFDQSIFKSMVQTITAYPQKLCFHLKNGLVLEEGRCIE